MKYITHFFLILLTIFVVTGCSNKSANNLPAAHETKSIVYKGGREDMVEQLYTELADKTPELKQLEKEISSNTKNVYELQNVFTSYNATSTDYYNAATNKANYIKDTALSNKIKKLVADSKNHYATKTAMLNNLIKLLNEKQLSVSDYHIALKISRTLPLIDKYQQDNLPAQAGYEELMKKLQETIKKMEQQIK